MFGKLKGKSRDPEKEKETEKSRRKEPLSGASKFLVIGAGALIMLAGAGFVLMQAVPGGSSGGNRQQIASGTDDQTSKKLQQLRQSAEQSSERSSRNSAPGEMPEDFFRKEKPEPGHEKKTLKASPASGKKTPQTQTSAARRDAGTDKILERLDAIKKSLNERLDRISAGIEKLDEKMTDNGNRIENLGERIAEATGGETASKEHASVLARKKELEKRVSSLQNRVEELKGKYNWVRHLESKRSKELKEARQKLESARRKIETVVRRPVFGQWQLAGVSDTEALLINSCSGEVKRVQPGDIFQGIEIQEIDPAAGIVYTNAGTEKL